MGSSQGSQMVTKRRTELTWASIGFCTEEYCGECALMGTYAIFSLGDNGAVHRCQMTWYLNICYTVLILPYWINDYLCTYWRCVVLMERNSLLPLTASFWFGTTYAWNLSNSQQPFWWKGPELCRFSWHRCFKAYLSYLCRHGSVTSLADNVWNTGTLCLWSSQHSAIQYTYTCNKD